MDGKEVGMVGLGLMGTAMSTRLFAAGWTVHGFDVVPEARHAHVERGGTVAETGAAVAARCPLLVLSLPHGGVVREAVFGRDGVAEGAAEGTVVVDTTTSRPEEAERVARELAERGVTYLDVGVSGNSALVARGEALGLIGGECKDVDAVSAMMRAFCREVMIAGASGDGMRAKLVVNHVLTINRYALAEGLVLAEKMAMDLPQTLSILRASAASSRAMDMWGTRMVERDYEPPASRVEGGNKDMQLILELGKAAGAPMLLLSQVDHVVKAMLANGMGGRDNAVLIEMLRSLAGIPASS